MSTLDDRSISNPDRLSVEGLRVRAEGDLWLVENAFGFIAECESEREAEEIKQMWLRADAKRRREGLTR